MSGEKLEKKVSNKKLSGFPFIIKKVKKLKMNFQEFLIIVYQRSLNQL